MSHYSEILDRINDEQNGVPSPRTKDSDVLAAARIIAESIDRLTNAILQSNQPTEINSKTKDFVVSNGDYVDRQQLDISQVVKFIDKCIESGSYKGEYLDYIEDSTTLRYIGVSYGAILYSNEEGNYGKDRTEDWLKYLSSK